jgi:hypothetical protein
MDSYDIIFLGYPIWYGYEPMAIRSFLASYNLSGKTIRLNRYNNFKPQLLIAGSLKITGKRTFCSFWL